jgi:hypothetical protein
MYSKEEVSIKAENILTIAIGVKEYTEKSLHMLPAAENNALEYVKEVASCWEPQSADWQKSIGQHENIFKRTDGAADYSTLRSEVYSFLKKATKKNNIDLIVFYYSGHGVWDNENGKYYLTVKETKEDDLIGTAWEISNLFDVLAESNKKVIVIIDSCFSENAFNFITSRKDYYIIASSAHNQTSKYPLNEEMSAFTGTFIDIIKNTGIQGAGDYLTFSEVFEETKRKLAENSLPVPKSLDKNGTGNTIICRNKFTNPLALPDETFNLSGAIIKIHRALFPNQDFNDSPHENVFKSYPTIISIYLNKILAQNEKFNEALIVDFYKQLISFLSFIFIKDLRDGRKLTPDDKKIFDAWKMPDFLHEHKIQIIKTAIQKYKDELFIKGLKDSIVFKIEHIEGLFTNDRKLKQPDEFLAFIFSLIEELSIFKHYELLAVRCIEVKKSFFNLKNYKHEVSILHGPQPPSYSYDYKIKGQCFQSENDFLNNAIILIPAISPADINRIITNKEFLNLWPFIIDSCCSQRQAQIPDLCMFKNIQKSFGDEIHYNYLKLQIDKEVKENITDYSRMTVFPEPKEWEQYIVETY